MKPIPFIYIVLLLFNFTVSFGQNIEQDYSELMREGWKLCLDKDFEKSAELYEKAFKLNKNVPLSHRYNASCIFALAGNKDRAFHHLFITAVDPDHHYIKSNEVDFVYRIG